ncbi:P-II family nitrogen regulator [Pseudomaricurvus sp. HS19]|uniref:P-II family nitrogen regulator n=1 Tax=Pseudomaricurvus sp. HS19 TaxID=2692626 RepID=UPI00136D3846|nr:P-II family nitrogen regulator [Pseudomaricurvus sp. HS19]
MKLVTAIIKPNALDAVREVLASMDVAGMSVSEVKGFGHPLEDSLIVRGTPFIQTFLPHLKVELVLPEDQADLVADAIQLISSGCDQGSGRVLVSGMQQALRIRTGEIGALAI